MKQLLKFFDYFFILKPVLLYPVWTLFLAGYYVQGNAALAAEQMGNNGSGSDSEPSLLLAGLAVTLLMGAVFILNQVVERDESASNTKVSLIAPGMLTPKVAFIEATLLTVCAVTVGFIASVVVGALLLLLLIVAGILYNFKPFSLKDRAVPAVISAGISSFLVFTLGWLVAGGGTSQLLLLAAPYVLTMLAIYMCTLAASDEHSGMSEVKEQPLSAMPLYGGLILALAALVLAFILADEIIFYPLLFSLPFFVWVAWGLSRHDLGRAVNYPVFLLALTLSFKWVIAASSYGLFFALLGFYLLSKLYYRLRFGINYPNLTVMSPQPDAS